MRYRKLTDSFDYQFGAGAVWLQDSPETVAQAIRTRLLLRTDEWFLNTDEGTPYAEKILGYGTQATRDPAIQQRILTTPGVDSIIKYVSHVSSDRKLVIAARVNTIYGPVDIQESF